MVGLLQLTPAFFQSDITAYEVQAGLPRTSSSSPSCWTDMRWTGFFANGEVSLDIEM